MISYFNRVTQTIRSKVFEPEYVIDRLANPTQRQKDLVDRIREETDENKRDNLKKATLPVITWNGEFTRRNTSGFIAPSGYLYFDIDTYVRPSQLLAVPEVSAAWKSVSGRGYGGLVRVENITKANFRCTYDEIHRRFKEKGIELDPLRDLARGNFISYDENLIFREGEVVEALEPTEEIRKFNTSNILQEMEDFTKCSIAMNYTSKKHQFVNGSRHRFTVSYFGACNQFGVPLDYAYSFADNHLCTSSSTWNKAVGIYRLYQNQHGTKQLS